MSDEWITGGASTPVWSAGQRTGGLPGVQMGQGCRVHVLSDERVRIALVGDVSVGQAQEQPLLEAAAGGRWADLTRLPGSYWVVVQSATSTFVCGDLSGFRSVFFAGQGASTVWSTRAGRLAQHCQSRPDLDMVLARVVAGPEHWPTRTTYDKVRAVPAGFGLLLGGGKPRLVDVSDIVPTLSLADGAPSFGEALEQAVAWRMAEVEVASSDVSGGLDSSSLAILAGRTGLVRAVTYADRYTSGEDLLYARRVASHMEVALEVGQGGSDELPFNWFWDQPLTDQPAALALTTAQHALYLRPVAGLPFHLTGNGGDIVLDSSSAAWIAMVQRGARRAARRQVTGWARARNRPAGALWQAVTRAASITHEEALLSAAQRLERAELEPRRPGVWSWCHLGSSASWLTAAGRERVGALLREAAGTSGWETRADLAEQRSSLGLVGADARDTGPLATSWRIRPVHPFLDNTVVRAAFSIDPIERHGVTSFKPLLAAAVPSLPPWLTGRRSKGSFTRQLTAGLIQHRPVLSHLLRNSSLATGGLLDPEPALAALNRIGGTRADALYDLQRLVMACHWLAARDQHLDARRHAAC
ncbi:asparagine synthase-related protein [Streptomyces griseus]|uniref:asparagine synthase-related protein n=1 Tax=Streptomyces griseus TaxID=1911 RepID=UPI00378766FE